MKKSLITSVLALLIAAGSTARSQEYPEEYLGLPGDNLNLYAVMKLFQDSETLEAFERSLNDENSMINNLDLNGDNMVDYITVTDYPEGDDHTIVLRAVLNRNEYQDVAVFDVERFRNGKVQIQLIGDEALYGKNYIVEPIYAETPNPGYRGRAVASNGVTVVTTTYYDIAAWPVIRYIFAPGYIGWHSSWYWGYYPVYWHTWRPWYWHYYYGYHYNWYPMYYSHYRHWNHFRSHRYNDYYYTRIRNYSPTVIVNINKGNYKNTYSRPEQRREGEALYSRTHAGQSTATRTNYSGNGDRRSSTTVSSRPAGSQQPNRSQEAARRSNTTTTSASRNTGNRQVSQGNSTTRRTESASAGSNTQRATTGNSQASTRRSTSGNGQAAAKSAPAQRTEATRTTTAGRSTSNNSSTTPAARTTTQTRSSSQASRSSSGSRASSGKAVSSKGESRSSQGRSSSTQKSSNSQKSSSSKESEKGKSSRR